MPSETWPYVLRAAIGNGPGEHAAGQDDDDVVAGVEVVGAADDALGLAGAVGVGRRRRGTS